MSMIPTPEHIEAVRSYMAESGRPLSPHTTAIALRSSGFAVGDATVLAVYEALRQPDGPEIRSLAGYVLQFTMGEVHAKPGGFYTRLLDCMLHADRTNLDLLGEGFPVLASMVVAFKNDPIGVARLREATKTGAWTP